LNGDVVTEIAKLSAERRRFAPFLTLGKIRQFGFLVSSALAEDGEHAFEKRMVDGNDGALRAAPSFQLIVLVAEIAILLVSRCPGAFG
jgi:hypothetical protein